MSLIIRAATPEDINACGEIIHKAFTNIATTHKFSPDFSNLEAAKFVAQTNIEDPLTFSVVAERNGKILGSNFLDKRDGIYGVGPISVDIDTQSSGVGRQLMQAVLKEGREARGIRLVQDAFNMASMSLYSSLGFDIREPLLTMKGKPKSEPLAEVEVRPFIMNDLEECASLCKKVLGFDRSQALQKALPCSSAFVALRKKKIIAYSSAITFWPLNYSVALDDEAMGALMLGAAPFCEEPLSFILMSRQTNFFRWCLSQGLRALSPRTLMTMGDYQEPQGYYSPTVFY
ncbi:Acetyltransferase (GNAT) family protein [Legionella nautarum]|uniref:Acetyltransferase (GNAT) family protein n=1 Tax=Legionella nautarum TaxID=45070 RepID=A0A0W0X474_9GAMM|nr:GNAT family N-acetyltransferase [Legionella nautarum]KTD39387.1 Acetyltransferase (GNAT) family protein [Legionella nautarum]